MLMHMIRNWILRLLLELFKNTFMEIKWSLKQNEKMDIISTRTLFSTRSLLHDGLLQIKEQLDL